MCLYTLVGSYVTPVKHTSDNVFFAWFNEDDGADVLNVYSSHFNVYSVFKRIIIAMSSYLGFTGTNDRHRF